MSQLEEAQNLIRKKEEDLEASRKEIQSLSNDKVRLEEKVSSLEKRALEKDEEWEEMQEKFRAEFKVLAQDILDDKSKKFTEKNHENLKQILDPLKEKIKSFESKVEETHKEEIRERAALKSQIESLKDMNQKMLEDAKNLTSALKGDNKIQGDWGEAQLRKYLEASGLKSGVHFTEQESFSSGDNQSLRPDFIIHLPEEKSLIIDSKVSLKAYSKYREAEDEEEKKKFLREHMASLWNHVKSLREKNYESIYKINSPDYILLFVPIEPALFAVLDEKPEFYMKALEKNVVVVTGSTLMATMRTVSFIWKQENLKQSIQEIANVGGDLYEKFSNFVGNMENIGTHLGRAQSSYDGAFKQLSEGKGNLVSRADKLKKLGANIKPNKELSKEIVEKALETDTEN